MFGLIGGILGKFVGIILVAKLLSYLIKKITKKATIEQEFTATLISTFLYIIIPTWITKTDESFNELMGWNVISIVSGLIIISFFALKLSSKQFLLVLVYCVLGWFLGYFILEIVLKLIMATTDNNLIGFITLGVSALFTPLLVFKQKLPFTKLLAERIK